MAIVAPAPGPLGAEFKYSDTLWSAHRGQKSHERSQTELPPGCIEGLAVVLQWLYANRGVPHQPPADLRAEAAFAEQPLAQDVPLSPLRASAPTAAAAETRACSYRVRDGTTTVSLKVLADVTVAAFCRLVAEQLRPSATPGTMTLRLSFRDAGAGRVVDLSLVDQDSLLVDAVPDQSTLSAQVSEPSAAELAALRAEQGMLQWEGQRVARELRGLQVLAAAIRGEKPVGVKVALPPLLESGDPAQLQERNAELRAENARLVKELRGMEAFVHRLRSHATGGEVDSTRSWRGAVVQGVVVPMPPDGSCLFHSLAHGLGRSDETAATLRREICDFIEREPDTLLAGKPLRDWILWESGQSHEGYVDVMRSSTEWGGPLEMAVCSHQRRVDIHVYQEVSGGYQQLVAFDVEGGGSTGCVSVVFRPGHYDAFQVTSA